MAQRCDDDFAVSGGPAVLFDAVSILLGVTDSETVVEIPQVQAFLRDAFAHGKFIGHALAAPLFAAAGLGGKADAGCFDLGLPDGGTGVDAFVAACARLRHWDRTCLA